MFLQYRKYFVACSYAIGLLLLLPYYASAATTALSYTYDNLNRLTQINYGNGLTEQYTYDAAGNRLTRSIVDSAPPTGSININNGAPYTNSTSVVLNISATDNSGSVAFMQFSQDDATWTAWENYATTKSYTFPTGDGLKTVYVRFKNGSGDVSIEYSASITLDTTPPVASITVAPSNPLNTRSAVFSFTANESGSTFQCQLDNGGYASCVSPASFAGLADGNHLFQVQAIDQAGNLSLTPAGYAWTVSVNTPSSTALPAGGKYNTTQTVKLTSNRPATIYYTTDGSAPTTSSSKYSAPIPITSSTVLKFFAVDLAGLTETLETETYTIDTTPPVLTVSTLPDGARTGNGTLNVSGTVSDESGVKELTINGVSVSLTSEGTFDEALTLVPGAKTLTTIATDQAGNKTTDTRIITLDQTAPALTLTTPADNISTAISFLDVTGTIAAGTTVMVKVNEGAPQQASITDAGFSATVTLAAGLNTIIITATDQNGKQNTAKRSVVYDSQKPSLSITDPNQDLVTSVKAFTIKGSLADALTSVTVTADDGLETFTPQITDGAFQQIFSFTDEKNYKINVTATDQSATSVSVARNVICRQGTIIINNGDQYTKTAAVALNLDYPNASQMQFSTNGTTWTSWAAFTKTKAFTLPSGNGQKTVYVRFKDGNAVVSSVYSAKIILDTAPPANGTITTTQVSGSAVNLTWQGFSDAISGIANYKLVSSTSGFPACSASPSYFGPSTSYSDSGLVTGNTYYYRVCAVDNAGNISTGATATRKVLALAEYDPPTGSISINSGSAYTKSAKVTLSLNATDASGVSQMCISNTTSCTAWSAYATGKAWALSSGDGPKTVYVRFKDKIGNANTAPYSADITLDTKAPKNGTVLITPASGNVLDIAWQDFNDATSGIESYIVVAGTTGYPACSATPVSSGPATSFNHTGLTVGKTYYYRVCSKDNAGNISTGATAAKKVLSEYTPPTGSVVINNGDLYTKTAKVTLAIHADDNGGSGLSQMCISNTATCTAWITYATSKVWTLAAGDSPKTANIQFKDKNGNATAPADAYHSNSILLDTKPPTNGTLQISDTFSLTWKDFADVPGGSGLKDYILARGTSGYPACSIASAINTADPTATAFDDSSITVAGKTYYYRVCARDNAGNISTGATASRKK